MCLSCTVNAIFNVKHWRDLEILASSRSRSITIGEVREEWGGEGKGGYRTARNRNVRKNSPQNATYLVFVGRPSGATVPCSALLDSSYQGQRTFPLQIVCLYLEVSK